MDVEIQEKASESEYKFLDERDLDPDYEPSKDTGESSPDDDKAALSDTEDQPPVTDQPEQPEQPEPPPPETGQNFVVAGRTYKSADDLAKALENANSKIAGQGQELGELRKLTEENEPEPDADDEEPPYDPYEQDAMKAWNEWDRRRVDQKLQAEKVEAEAKITQQQALEGMLRDFSDKHSDLSPEEMVEVAGVADQLMKGNDVMEVAFGQWSNNRSQNTPGKEPEKSTQKSIDKAGLADQLPDKPKGGGGKGKADLTAERIDEMTPDQYGKLPRDIRDKYLDGDF